MAETFTISGACTGYKRGATFEFTNGQVWEQTSPDYDYTYLFRPEVYLEAYGSRGRLKVEEMDEWVDVKRVR